MGFPTPINEGANIQKFLNQPTGNYKFSSPRENR
ncbi:MAG: hypothetical protein RLZZ500_2029 [Bacteroidota bacterium]|jgi:hypothetical protein